MDEKRHDPPNNYYPYRLKKRDTRRRLVIDLTEIKVIAPPEGISERQIFVPKEPPTTNGLQKETQKQHQQRGLGVDNIHRPINSDAAVSNVSQHDVSAPLITDPNIQSEKVTTSGNAGHTSNMIANLSHSTRDNTKTGTLMASRDTNDSTKRSIDGPATDVFLRNEKAQPYGKQDSREKRWFDDVGIQDLEDWVMEELDQMICRVEERDIMKQLDHMILQREEEDAKKQLLRRVNGSEDRDFVLPRLVRDLTVVAHNVSRTEKSGSMLPSPWSGKIRCRKRKRLERERSHDGTVASGTSKVIGSPEMVELKSVRQRLPRWSPGDAGNKPFVLFTRKEYLKTVVRPLLAKPKYDGVSFLHYFNVTLSDHHPNHYNSFELQATGTTQQLNKLLNLTSSFVRSMIAHANVRRLWNDEHSILLDVPVNVQQKLNVTTSLFRLQDNDKERAIPGVWLTRVDPQGSLARAVGSSSVLNNGCAVVAIDQTSVHNAHQMKYALERAMKALKKEVLVSLCLSKFANLSELSSELRPKLKFRNGTPYQETVHEAMIRLHRAFNIE